MTLPTLEVGQLFVKTRTASRFHVADFGSDRHAVCGWDIGWTAREAKAWHPEAAKLCTRCVARLAEREQWQAKQAEQVALAHEPVVPARVIRAEDVSLTPREREALAALYSSQYYSGSGAPNTWQWDVVENSTITNRSVGGVVGSLNKKGLVTSHGAGQDASIAVTALGHEVALLRGIRTAAQD